MMGDFGTVLRQKRREAGLSQRRLAKEAQVDFSYISKLENGRLPAPAPKTVVRLAELIGCPPEELLAAARKMPSEVGDSLSGEPAALRFLQEASKMNLSHDEWERMIGTLQSLRSRSTD